MTQQQVIEKIIKQFDSSFKDFDKTRLKDPLVGFSLRGTYSEWLRKKLRIRDNKNYVPFLYLYLDKEIENLDELRVNRIPLVVKIDFLLKDEDFFDGEVNYVVDRKHIGNKLYLPINFHSDDEFYYDVEKNKFFKSSTTQEVSLIDIYEQVMKLHISSYTNYIGLRARALIFIKNQFPSILINSVSLVLGVFHWFIVGNLYTYDPIMARLTDDLKDETKISKSRDKKEEIDFFGYKVRIWTIGSYSFLIISTFLIWHFIGKSSPITLRIVLTNNFLAIIFAIFTIVVYDSVLPSVLKFCIKWMKEFGIKKRLTEIKLSI